MYKYMEKKNEVNFDKIFNQVLGECIVWYVLRIILIRDSDGERSWGWTLDVYSSITFQQMMGRIC